MYPLACVYTCICSGQAEAGLGDGVLDNIGSMCYQAGMFFETVNAQFRRHVRGSAC